MVIDTSALIAIMLDEPPAGRLIAAIDAAEVRRLSAATVVEASLVLLGRFGEAGDVQLDRLMREIRAEIVPVDEVQVAIARDAAVRFGRGRHSAGLNFGDVFSYALSASVGEPLLYVGDDFSKTDVEPVTW